MPDATIALRAIAVSRIYLDNFDHITAYWVGMELKLAQVAKMAVWMIILFFIPIVNIVVGVMMWAKICTARGKSPWLVIMMFIPIVNIIFLPYLAFSE